MADTQYPDIFIPIRLSEAEEEEIRQKLADYRKKFARIMSPGKKCTECNGTGKIALFTSVSRCETCGGTGIVTP